MGMLDGDIAKSIYAGFTGKLLSGEVRRKTRPSSGANDDHGDPVDLDTEIWQIEGFFDDYSRFTRAQAGIPDSTIKACVFAQSAPDWTPHKDDMVRLGTQWSRLAGGPLGIDPAGALWTLDAEKCEAPR